MSILKRTTKGSSRLIAIGLILTLLTGFVLAGKWESISTFAQSVSESFSFSKTDNIGGVTINVRDGILAEPVSGTRDLVFTITLSQAAVANVSVSFQTADGTAVSGTCGTDDYTNTNGSTTFFPGERLKTVNVPVCADVLNEANETFLVNLTNPVGAVIGDGQGIGTITQANPPGSLIISEIRTSGPGGAGDDFVEIYNNSDSPHTVTASDSSAGYGIYKMGTSCNADPILIGIIPNATIIPARGHFLLVGSAYTLGNYGGTGAAAGNLTMTSDIENDRNVAIFTTSDIASLSSVNRLDAVGFGINVGGACNLLREGSTLPALFGSTLEYTFFRYQCALLVPGCLVNGAKRDTNTNADDFFFAETTGTAVAGVGERLGAPGPENITGPRSVNGGVQISLLDSTVAPNAAPNQVRDLTSDPPNNSTFGTYEFRRRFTNNTGSTITRLRFRIVDITTDTGPSSLFADLRARTSMPAVINGILDSTTCSSTGTPTTVPCQVTAQATTLEQPPTQAAGGGFNSTLTASLLGGLPTGQSMNFNFLFGVQNNPMASFRVCFVVESLPTGGSTTHCISEGFSTAANVSLSGQVRRGKIPLRSVTVMLSGAGLSEPRIARTSSFGYYTFEDVPVGNTYVIQVFSGRYNFPQPSIVINAEDNLTNLDFLAEEP
jgi:Calx-beta domain